MDRSDTPPWRVLLTGATGFVGSHVLSQLVAHGHQVTTIRRPEHDLLAPDFIAPTGTVDICIHLAWDVTPGRYLSASSNHDYLAASVRLASQLAERGCRKIIGIGTCFEYQASAQPLRESSPTQPRSVYAQSKLNLLNALRSLDLDLTWVRLFYLYGPGEKPNRLVPHIVRKLLSNEPCPLVPAEQVRDFLHVDDVASAIVACAETGLTGIVNIGSSEPVTIRELAETIGTLTGRSELLRFGAQPYAPDEVMHIVADNTRLRTEAGWSPNYSLPDGLRQTIEWWRARL